MKLILVIFLGYWMVIAAQGQETTSSLNPEVQFQQAREAAFAGKYNRAHTLLHDLLIAEPLNHDAALLESRIFLWQKNYSESQNVFNRVQTAFPESDDVKELGYDLAFFSGNFAEVVKQAPELIEKFPDRIDFREKYAQALWALDRREQAGKVADEILAIDPSNNVALEIKRMLAEPKHPLKLHLNYSFDNFEKPYSRWWNLFSAGLSKKYDHFSIGGTLNVGHLNNVKTEYQAEVESYITLTPKSYMYAMYGYSPGIYFPTQKSSLEVWHQLPAEMFVSLGANYYRWNDHVFIGTASLEKYLNRYWLCLRAYAHFKSVGTSTSWYFTARRYFAEDHYFQLTIGTGTAPDEPYDIKTDLDRLNAHSIRALYVRQLSPRTALRAGLGYSYEEYAVNTYRSRIDGTIGIIYLLSK